MNIVAADEARITRLEIALACVALVFLAAVVVVANIVPGSTTLPLSWRASYLIALFVCIGVAAGLVLHFGCVLARNRFFAFIRRRGVQVQHTHEIGGHIVGVLGVLYAVVVAFVVVTAWQQYDHASEVATQEQEDVSAIFHTVSALRSDRAKAIEQYLLSYAEDMHGEWKQMRSSEPLCLDNADITDACELRGNMFSPSVHLNTIAHEIGDCIADLRPSKPWETILYLRSMQLVSDLDGTRQHRRHHFQTSPLQNIFWMALLVGAVILVSVSYFLEQPLTPLQAIRTCALCATISLMCALALAFSHPFTGAINITDTGWESMILHFKNDEKELALEQPPTLHKETDCTWRRTHAQSR